MKAHIGVGSAHMCNLFGKQVHHGGHHSHILPLWECVSGKRYEAKASGIQMPLVDIGTVIKVKSTGDMESDFISFREANPGVYQALMQVALWCKGRGMKMGIKACYEVVRWQTSFTTTGDVFRLNNNHTAFYSRLIMKNVPELDGFFITRKRRSKQLEIKL